MLSNKLVASIRDLFDFDKAFEIFKDKAYSEIGKFIFETFTSLGGGFLNSGMVLQIRLMDIWMEPIEEHKEWQNLFLALFLQRLQCIFLRQHL